MRHAMKIGAIAAALLITGCSSSQPAVDPTDAANAIKAAVSDVTQIEPLTAETDANKLLGRPNGYKAAIVLHDSRAQCASDGPGVDCGATLEQWPDADSAEQRRDYLQKLFKSAPMLGSEYDYLDGDLLLRVTGQLSADQAKEYQTAFEH